MIYFVTDKIEYYKTSINTNVFKDITLLDPIAGINLYYKKFSKAKIIAFDIEATGLDPYLLKPILYGFGFKSEQIIFDWTVSINDIFKSIKSNNTVLLGHNLKYDLKVIAVHNHIENFKVYDTMLADQRLYMKSGYSWSYASLVERYCNKKLIKTVRNEFIGVDLDKFKITPQHLYYLKDDLVDLFNIREKQRPIIKRFGMEFLIYGIEFPLIPIVAEAELTGFILNKEEWLKRLDTEMVEKFRIECELDAEVIRLRELVATTPKPNLNTRLLLTGGKFDHKRIHNKEYDIFKSDGTTSNLDLFGESMSHSAVTRTKKKIERNPNNTNYNAKASICYIFAALGEPMINSSEQFSVPKLSNQGKIIGGVNSYTIKADFLQKYILLKPETIMSKFIELKLEHSKLEKSIGTYGESFINMINPVTGRLHTSFRQCFADTGRFQSGGGALEPDKPNFQNIPAKIEFRKCFTVDTSKYSVITADYSGAELIVMASHAQDFKLIELSLGDMHSHMATVCWRNIYTARAKKLAKVFESFPDLRTDELHKELLEYLDKQTSYTVTKADKAIRSGFKPLTFGTVYGMFAKKAATSLNISVDEGSIVLNTIKGELPKTMKMVERASMDATRQGYVILNERTNSRAWFPMLIKQLQGRTNPSSDFIEINAEKSAARNIRIQGTQADFVKEAIVVLKREFLRNHLDAIMLSYVHDEIVFQVPKHLDGKSEEWITYIEANPNFKLYSPISGLEYNNIKDFIKDLMENVANRYLNNVKIQVELETYPHWVK